MKLLLCVLLSFPIYAAPYTASVTGNWNSAATFGGAGIPVSGDSVTINDGVTLTIPGGYTAIAGNSDGTPAIQCASITGTGVLVNNGTLVFRGPVSGCNAQWVYGAGSHTQHDSSLAASPSTTHYVWTVSQADAGSGFSAGSLAINGTSGAHATIDTAAGSGAAGGWGGGQTGFADGGIVNATYADIDKWGLNTTFYLLGFNLFHANKTVSFDHCHITNSGPIFNHVGESGGTFSITNSDIWNPVTNPLDISIAGNGATWTISHSTIQGQMLISGAQFSISNSFLFSSANSINTNGSTDALTMTDTIFFSDNPSTGGANSCCAGTWTRVAAVRGCSQPGNVCPSNPHFFDLAQLNGGNLAINGMLIDLETGIDTSGDAFQVTAIPSAPRTISLSNIIGGNTTLINTSDSSGNVTYSNLQISVANIVYNINSPTNDCSGIFCAEDNAGAITYPAGLYQTVKNSIFYGADGLGPVFWHNNTITTPAGTYTGVDYNGKFNIAPNPYYYVSGSTTQNKPGQAAFSSPNPPGGHDVTGDPGFLQLRRFIDWCKTGDPAIVTFDDCRDRMKSMNQAGFNTWFLPANIYPWVSAGYRPSNPAYLTASDTGGPVGLTLTAASSQITNVSVQAISTSALINFQAPDAGSCTVDVTTHLNAGVPDYTRPVNAVNTAFFSNANVAAGPALGRSFPIGLTFAVRTSPITNWKYTYGLQQDTKHYGHIACTASTYDFAFTTPPRPGGSTWTPKPTPDPANPGGLLLPTRDLSNPTQELIDHLYGVTLKPMAYPGLFSYNEVAGGVVGPTNFWGVRSSSSNWTNVNGGFLTNTGTPALYQGTTKDTLALLPAIDLHNYSTFDWIQLELNGWGDGAAPADREVEACLSRDKLTCLSPWRSTVLPVAQTGYLGIPATQPAVWDNWIPAYLPQIDTTDVDADASAGGYWIKNFSAVSNTTPIRVTVADPNIDGLVLNEGATYWTFDAQGNPGANGKFTVHQVSATQYDLIGSTSSGTWTSGGGISRINFGFGLLVRKKSASNDAIHIAHARFTTAASMPSGGFSGGMGDFCSQLLNSAGGYNCVIPGSNGGASQMFMLDPINFTSRYLGSLPNVNFLFTVGWSSTDPETFYCQPGSTNSIASYTYVGASSHPAVAGDVHAPVGSKTLVSGFTGLVQSWIAANRPDGFTMPVNSDFQFAGQQGHYAILSGSTHQPGESSQDTFGWFAAIYMDGTKALGEAGSLTRVVASFPMYNTTYARWSENHSYYWNPSERFVTVANGLAKDGGNQPNGGKQYHLTVNQAMTAGTSTMVVTSGNDGTGGTSRTGEPFGADSSWLKQLMPMVVGDTVLCNGEPMKIAGKVSYDSTANAWTLTMARGIYGHSANAGGGFITPIGHSAGEDCIMKPTPELPGTEWNDADYNPHTAWDFINDPHGLAVHNTHYASSSHDVLRGRYLNGGQGGVVDAGVGNIAIECCTYQYNSYTVPINTTFSGVVGRCEGDGCEVHPSEAQVEHAVDAAAKTHYEDVHPLVGLASRWIPLRSGCDPNIAGTPGVGGACSMQRVNGASCGTTSPSTCNVYKVVQLDDGTAPPADTLQPRRVRTFAYNNGRNFMEKSGRGSLVDDTTPYVICIPDGHAGECRADSTGSEVAYVVTPTITSFGCNAYADDLCLGNQGVSVGNFVQHGYGGGAASIKGTRVLTNGFSTPRGLARTQNMRETVDGRLSTLQIQPGFNMAVMKNPSWPALDTMNRADFIGVPVTLNPSAALAVNNAVIEFGYDSRLYCAGQDADGNWDGRAEICVKGTQSGTNYDFAGDAVTGVPCASGCTVTIPAIAQRMLYWRVVYRNPANGVISRGDINITPVN